jgi:dihydroorotate dehydrogenase
MRSWRRAAYRVVRPLLFTGDAESIHHLTLSALSTAGRSGPGRALCGFAGGVPSTTAPVAVMGLTFRNRIGVAAGFDKDGVAIGGWAALGLGHVELGTVTPRPQPGNPRPRLFRLTADAALVNRMGFNNRGADALASAIQVARPSLPAGFVIGVNIGRNRDTPEDRAVEDYVAAARAVGPVADYLAINVSSPNTPGLRDLATPDRIGPLIAAVAEAAGDRPILVKLSPDIGNRSLDELLAAIAESPASGLVLANTSAGRDGLRTASPPADGGLSGKPLFGRMLAVVARARARPGRRLTIIASGGVGSARGAAAAVQAGADLVQLWTGLVYAGTGLIGECVHITAAHPDDARGR